MKRTVITCCKEETPEENLKLCFEQIDKECISPILIIFFCDYENLWLYTKELKNKYPNSTSIGCSSYTFFSSEGLSKQGLIAMAINFGIECSSGQLYEVHRYPLNYKNHIKQALASLSSTENTCCLEFTTAFSRGEELVLDTFDTMLKGLNIPVLGGSAGTVKGETKTAVGLNGDIYVDTCVFVLIHNLNGKIAFGTENLFKKTNLEFFATDIDCDERKVYEFDNKPAVFALSEALKINPPQLKNRLQREPLGRVVKDEIFITGIDEVFPDGSISFFSRIYNHTKMALLRVADFQTIWTKTAQQLLPQVQKPSFTIAINCLSRSILFEEENQMENFVSKLKDMNRIFNHTKEICCDEQNIYLIGD